MLKATSLALVAALLSAALVSAAPPLNASWNSSSDSLAHLASTMIANAERLSLNIQLLIDRYNLTSWFNSTFAEQYYNALELLEQAKTMYSQGDYSAALASAKASLWLLAPILHQIRLQISLVEPALSEACLELETAITRAMLRLSQLNRTIELLKGQGVQVPSVITQLLGYAEAKLEEASKLLEEGNITAAEQALREASSIMGKLHGLLNKLVVSKAAVMKARHYAWRFMRWVEQLEQMNSTFANMTLEQLEDLLNSINATCHRMHGLYGALVKLDKLLASLGVNETVVSDLKAQLFNLTKAISKAEALKGYAKHLCEEKKHGGGQGEHGKHGGHGGHGGGKGGCEGGHGKGKGGGKGKP